MSGDKVGYNLSLFASDDSDHCVANLSVRETETEAGTRVLPMAERDVILIAGRHNISQPVKTLLSLSAVFPDSSGAGELSAVQTNASGLGGIICI